MLFRLFVLVLCLGLSTLVSGQTVQTYTLAVTTGPSPAAGTSVVWSLSWPAATIVCGQPKIIPAPAPLVITAGLGSLRTAWDDPTNPTLDCVSPNYLTALLAGMPPCTLSAQAQCPVYSSYVEVIGTDTSGAPSVAWSLAAVPTFQLPAAVVVGVVPVQRPHLGR